MSKHGKQKSQECQKLGSIIYSGDDFLTFLNQGNNEILKLLDRLWLLNGGLPLMAMWLGLNTVNS